MHQLNFFYQNFIFCSASGDVIYALIYKTCFFVFVLFVLLVVARLIPAHKIWPLIPERGRSLDKGVVWSACVLCARASWCLWRCRTTEVLPCDPDTHRSCETRLLSSRSLCYRAPVNIWIQNSPNSTSVRYSPTRCHPRHRFSWCLCRPLRCPPRTDPSRSPPSNSVRSSPRWSAPAPTTGNGRDVRGKTEILCCTPRIGSHRLDRDSCVLCLDPDSTERELKWEEIFSF